jgi:hypothetical protein
MVKRQFSHADVTYSADIDAENEKITFSVNKPTKSEVPKYLYKYYPMNQYSVDAVVQNYLFASHPMLMNDKYDCSNELVDYSGLDKATLFEFLVRDMGIFTEERFEQLCDPEDNWVLERTMGELNLMKLFMKFGIISLTENYKDALMWAYYAQNSGFAIKIDLSLLPEELSGPFPINYIKDFNKIDLIRYGSELSMLYQTNVKQELWKNENEWRYLAYNKFGKYHPLYRKHDITSRYVYYDINAVKEVILGYDFFNPEEIDLNKRTREFDIMNFNSRKSKLSKKLKKKLLNHLLTNEIPISQIVRHRQEYLLDAKDLKIEKLSPNRYKVYNIFKNVVA